MDQEQIRQLVQQINETWLLYEPEQFREVLGPCFHPDIVFRGPKMEALSRGREACIQSYADFARQASISSCTLSTPEIDLTGDTAVATYSWKLGYSMKGQKYNDSGHDVFVFSRTEGRWLAVWRTLLTDA